ncbi:MAG: nucleotide sugar dehydrogenase [Cyclobacteriaceae bacterium]
MTKIGVIGLGYVGLPLAIEFQKKFEVVGYDVSSKRISDLSSGIDLTKEVEREALQQAEGIVFTSNSNDLKSCNIYIVTVPTPIDRNKNPDLTILRRATKTVSNLLEEGDIVIYESTVFPGCTEEICVPILEKGSGLKFNKHFFCGYSPERVNPGDKVHRLTTIQKVTSGSTPKVAAKIDALYREIIGAGTFLVSSIRVAEAAKAIENAQRDVNIAFINELAMIFERMELDTHEVLAAAGTKWNFLKFTPGLVGGHCIGVDPYYLTHKSEELGYKSQIILSGRKINDEMGAWIAQKVVKLLARKERFHEKTKMLILGITFKENCPDIRNTKVVDIVYELEEFGIDTDVFDSNADPKEVMEEYGIDLIENPNFDIYDGIILAVAHEQFLEFDWNAISKSNSIVYDVKSILNPKFVDGRL